MPAPSLAAAAALLAALLAGCQSGELGERPIVEFGNPATEGTSGNITIRFTITDEDHSVSDVRVEYSVGGAAWLPAALASSDVGTASNGVVSEIRARSEPLACSVVWDSWANRVGAGGDADISIRLTPSDIDGVGEPVVLSPTFTVNNNFAELVVLETTVDFGVRLARVPEKPADDRHLTIRNGTGASGTTLYWTVASSESWLKVAPSSGTTPAAGPYESVVTLTADVDGAPLSAQAAPYAAILTITGKDTDAAGPDAHGTPQQVVATVIVRDPEAEIFVHNGDGSTEVTSLPEFVMEEGGANPAPQSFWVMNAGDEGSVLSWSADDNLSVPDWLVGFDGSTTGDTAATLSDQVTVAVDGTGLAAGTYSALITVSGTEQTSNAPARGGARTVGVSLRIDPSIAEPEIGVSPASLTFSAMEGGANPDSQTLEITNTGGGALSWTVSADRPWIQVSPSSGTTTVETDVISVAVSTSRPEAWTGTTTTDGAPVGREDFCLVWTGSRMICWGGNSTVGGALLNTGAVYSPASDQWTDTVETLGAPAARWGHAGVWTGSAMIVWGGHDGTSHRNDGWSYDPVSRSWSGPLSSNGAPAARYAHSAVWTGTEMIVWGGYTSSGWTNTGARYNPLTDTWLAMADGPTARHAHSAVWTGTEMILWGGEDAGGRLNAGAVYEPATDQWTQTTSLSNAPPARSSHSAVWTGSEMVVWGGNDSTGYADDGARYDPFQDKWLGQTSPSLLSERRSHEAVWTTNEMIVWGGHKSVFLNDGARYQPPINLSVGTHTGAITISDPNATNDPQTVNVTLTVADDPGLVAWWRLDETGGTTVVDSSGNGHDGFRDGATFVGGKIDGAYDFNGIDDNVNIPHAASLNVLPITASLCYSATRN